MKLSSDDFSVELKLVLQSLKSSNKNMNKAWSFDISFPFCAEEDTTIYRPEEPLRYINHVFDDPSRYGWLQINKL